MHTAHLGVQIGYLQQRGYPFKHCYTHLGVCFFREVQFAETCFLLQYVTFCIILIMLYRSQFCCFCLTLPITYPYYINICLGYIWLHITRLGVKFVRKHVESAFSVHFG